jgi:hypothetical protein
LPASVVNVEHAGSHKAHGMSQRKAVVAKRVYDKCISTKVSTHVDTSVVNHATTSRAAVDQADAAALARRERIRAAAARAPNPYLMYKPSTDGAHKWKPQKSPYTLPEVNLADASMAATGSAKQLRQKVFRRRRTFGSIVDGQASNHRFGSAEWASQTQAPGFYDPFVHKRNFAVC